MTMDKALRARVLVEELELFNDVLERTNKDILLIKKGKSEYAVALNIFVDARDDLKEKIKKAKKELENL